MKKPFAPLLLGLLIVSAISCTKIPSQSVQLAANLQAQGTKMNDLNLALVNALFAEKKIQVSDFIQKEYTPSIIDNYFKKLPNQSYTKTETTQIINALMPEISKQREDMLNNLEQNRVKLITRLNNDYVYYVTGTDALKNLLASATKLQDANSNLGARASQLTGGKLNITEVTKALEKLTVGAGDIASKINTLNTDIQLILEK